MKGLEKRLIVIPQGQFGRKSLIDFVKLIKSITDTIDTVDTDLQIKQTFDQVMLKEKRIKKFKGKDVNEFHLAIMKQVTSNGTQFLISKN